MRLTERAKACHNCVCWLQHCQAECCSQFHFPLQLASDVVLEDAIVRVRIPMTTDRKWYFELHGIEVQDDVLLIPEKDCRFNPGLLSVHRRCSLLTAENLCAGHPDNKPDICKNLTLDNAKEGKYHLTPNCLFVYKQKLG